MALKITSFLIAIVFISVVVGVSGLYMSELSNKYGVSYDSSNIESYEQLDEIQSLSQEIEEGSDITERTGVVDIIGGYFTDAYSVLQITLGSFNLFDTMSNQAVEDANLGAAGRYFRVGLATAILILIVLGVIISAIVKRDL